MEMVVTVLGRPPENALLGSALREKCEDELESPVRRVGTVGEIPVVAGTYPKDPEPVECHPEHDRLQGHARPEGGETAQVNEQERYGRWIENVVVVGGRGAGRGFVGVHGAAVY